MYIYIYVYIHEHVPRQWCRVNPSDSAGLLLDVADRKKSENINK